MRVVISGASGLLGTALTQSLRADGHTVVALVRRTALSPDESTWNPATGRIDHDVIAASDAVVNLAGASIGDKRLTSGYKRVVLHSRVDSTHTVAGAIASANPSAILLQGSAMGYYGDRGPEPLSERMKPGKGFLADVCLAWEEAARPAAEAGAHVAYLRTGLVLAPHGGFAKRLLPLARRGLLGSMGNGAALQSWITLDDTVSAMRFLLEQRHQGAVNVVAPQPAPISDVIGSLARAFGATPGLTVPAWVLHAVIGEAADDLLASQAGVPGVLNRLGFTWSHPTLDDAASYVAAGAK